MKKEHKIHSVSNDIKIKMHTKRRDKEKMFPFITDVLRGKLSLKLQ